MNNFNINFKSKQLWSGIILGLLLCLLFGKMNKRSGYSYTTTGSDIITQEAPGNVQSIFDLKQSQECLPGPSPTTSPYTLGTDGICGAQAAVAAAANYTITDGIGGSPLDATEMQLVNQLVSQ